MAKEKEKKEKVQDDGFITATELPEVRRVSTGFVSLDWALGGGLALGSIVELYGYESEGKTTLGLQIMDYLISQGFKAMFFDLEHCIDPAYLRSLIDTKKLYVSQPLSVEETFNGAEREVELMDPETEKLITAKVKTKGIYDFMEKFPREPKIFLVDSTAAMSTEKELAEESERAGAIAAYLSSAKGVRGIIQESEYPNTIAMFTSQVRQHVNFGNKFDKANFTLRGQEKFYTTGGTALKFYAGHRIEVSATSLVKEGAERESRETVGKKVSCYIKKNKYGAPYRTVPLKLIFGQGYSRMMDLVEFALVCGVIEKSGSWYNYEAMKEQGIKPFVERCEADGDFRKRLWERCTTLAGESVQQVSEE